MDLLKLTRMGLAAEAAAAGKRVNKPFLDGHKRSKKKAEFEQEGLNQIYLISKAIPHADGGPAVRDVLMRSGNFLYGGRADIGCEEINLRALPEVAPRVQQQQAMFQFLCEAHAIDDANRYFRPLKKFYKRISFLADELGGCRGDKVYDLVDAGRGQFSWVDDDDALTFFEFKTEHDPCLENVDAIISKTYDRGLILIIYYLE